MLFDAVALKSLRVSHPEELPQVTMATPQVFNNPIWEQIRDRQDAFSRIFAYGRWRFNLARGGEARYVNEFVSGRYFDDAGRRLATLSGFIGALGAAAGERRTLRRDVAQYRAAAE